MYFFLFRSQKSRMEKINEIIAKSQTQAQLMMASGGYHDYSSRDVSLLTPRSGGFSPDTSLADNSALLNTSYNSNAASTDPMHVVSSTPEHKCWQSSLHFSIMQSSLFCLKNSCLGDRCAKKGSFQFLILYAFTLKLKFGTAVWKTEASVFPAHNSKPKQSKDCDNMIIFSFVHVCRVFVVYQFECLWSWLDLLVVFIIILFI